MSDSAFIQAVCLEKRDPLLSPYLCSCRVRYSNASAVCLATPSRKQHGDWGGGTKGGCDRKKKRRETLISQKLKAHKQVVVLRRSADACWDPHLHSRNRHPILKPFISKQMPPQLSKTFLRRTDHCREALNDSCRHAAWVCAWKIHLETAEFKFRPYTVKCGWIWSLSYSCHMNTNEKSKAQWMIKLKNFSSYTETCGKTISFVLIH